MKGYSLRQCLFGTRRRNIMSRFEKFAAIYIRRPVLVRDLSCIIHQYIYSFSSLKRCVFSLLIEYIHRKHVPWEYIEIQNDLFLS